MQLIFATNNPNKIKEVKNILPPSITLANLSDIGCYDELPENGNTIKSNAYQKGRYVHDKYGVDCFSDDTGLEVLALDNRPGVYSARYAGAAADSSDNMNKLLYELRGIKNRTAVFRTIIALFIKEKEYFFEGEIKGRITEFPSGEEGFGYDPVFVPDGFKKTFSEMTASEKNKISHRKIAIDKLSEFLSKKYLK